MRKCAADVLGVRRNGNPRQFKRFMNRLGEQVSDCSVTFVAGYWFFLWRVIRWCSSTRCESIPPIFFICSRACSAFGSARGTVAGPPPDSISFSPLYRGTSRGRTRSGTRSAAAGAGFAAARARPPVATDFVGSFPDFFTILLAAFCTTFFVAFLPALLAGLATTARFIACAGLGAGFFEAFLADFPDGFFADFFAGMGFSDSGGQRGFLFRPS